MLPNGGPVGRGDGPWALSSSSLERFKAGYIEPADGWHREVGYTPQEYDVIQANKLAARPLLADMQCPDLKKSAYCEEFPQHMDKNCPPTDMSKSMVDERLKYWPDIPFAVTAAPFLLSPHERPIQSPIDQQKKPIFGFLRIPELGSRLIEHLTHEDLKNFALTSSMTHEWISNLMDHWNVTNGNFNDCEKNDKQCLASFGDAKHHRATKRTLVVSPVRLGTMSATDSRRKYIGYRQQLQNIFSLTQSLYHYGQNVRDLHLHRIPFLDHKMLRVILSGHSMPKLASLGVYRCELLHFGHTMELLAIAERRRDVGHPLRDLDFYPRYHDGPNDRHREGSYGVTWEDTGVDTARAIFSHLLYRILPKAEELGFDMTNRSTSFRAWLEKIPLPPLCLPRILDLHFRRRDARRENPMVRSDVKATRELHHQFLAAMTYPNDKKQTTCMDWDTQKVCDRCKTQMVKLMFRSPIAPSCAGCWLSDYMTEREADHYKLNKQYVISMLLSREHDMPKDFPKDVKHDDLLDRQDNDAIAAMQAASAPSASSPTTPAQTTTPSQNAATQNTATTQTTPVQTAPAHTTATQTTPAQNTTTQTTPTQTTPAQNTAAQNPSPAPVVVRTSPRPKKKTRDEIVFFLDVRNVVDTDKTGKSDRKQKVPWKWRLETALNHAAWLEWMRICNESNQPFEAPQDIVYNQRTNTVFGKNPIMPSGSWERDPPQHPNPSRIRNWTKATPFQIGEQRNYNSMTSWDWLRVRPDASKLDERDAQKQKESIAAAAAKATTTTTSPCNQAGTGGAPSGQRSGGRRGRKGGRGGGHGGSQLSGGASQKGGSTNNHGSINSLAMVGGTNQQMGNKNNNNNHHRGGQGNNALSKIGTNPQATTQLVHRPVNNVWARGGSHGGGAARAGAGPQANNVRGGNNNNNNNNSHHGGSSPRGGSHQQNKGQTVGGGQKAGGLPSPSGTQEVHPPRLNPQTNSGPWNFPLTREQIKLLKIDTRTRLPAPESFW